MSKKAIWTIVIVVGAAFLVIWFSTISLMLKGLVQSQVTVKKGSVLMANLSGTFQEEQPGAMEKLFGMKKKLTIQDIVDLLRAAKTDPRIEAVLINSGMPQQVGWAKAEEIRNAFLDFRESGKPLIAFAEVGTDKEYYMMSAADSITMPELGTLMVDGLAAKVGFLTGTYGKVGIKWEGIKRGKYKSATEPYTRDSMSDAFKEELGALLDDIYADYLNAIATSRKKTVEEVTAIVDSGPYLDAKAALGAGLIDRIGYLEEIERELGISPATSNTADKGKGIDWRDYSASTKTAISLAPKKIAIVQAVGSITTGNSRRDPLSGKIMGSTTISKAIRQAADDEAVKAIVMRVDSPGGSALASDIIWHEVLKAKEKKPFIVSMGDVAGSGGYYISCGADVIVAQPGTITGSVGVLALIPDMSGLQNKIGYKTDGMKRGEHADFLSTDRPLTDWERQNLDTYIGVVYDRFVNIVATSRGKTYDQIDSVAQGRIWSGVAAKKVGLVDEIGNLESALKIARQKAGISEGEKVTLVYYPKKKSFSEMLREGEFTERIASTVWERMPEELRQVAERSRLESMYRNEPVLLLVPEKIEIE
jgi:protease-4